VRAVWFFVRSSDDGARASRPPARCRRSPSSPSSTKAGDLATVRPTDERWSILSTARIFGDVFISIRERNIAACVLDEPTGTQLYP